MLYALITPYLLRSLMLFIFVSSASASDEISTSLALEARNLALENAKAKFAELSPKNAKTVEDLDKPRLLIFVSSSMPVSLLKSYVKEASRYNAALVFKCLPGGSFKEMSKLMIEIYDEYNEALGTHAGSIIDDEAFNKFRVITVPSLVLAKEEDCFAEHSCKIIYDKIVGNVGIRAALEKFMDEGDMRSAANDLLNMRAH